MSKSNRELAEEIVLKANGLEGAVWEKAWDHEVTTRPNHLADMITQALDAKDAIIKADLLEAQGYIEEQDLKIQRLEAGRQVSSPGQITAGLLDFDGTLKENAIRVVQACQDDHGMSPYLKTSLELRVHEAMEWAFQKGAKDAEKSEKRGETAKTSPESVMALAGLLKHDMTHYEDCAALSGDDGDYECNCGMQKDWDAAREAQEKVRKIMEGK